MYDKSTDQLDQILGKASDQKELQEYLKSIGQSGDDLTIRGYFNYMIARKQLDAAEIVRASNLVPAYAYQILNGTRTKPARMKTVALCLGCRLTLPETQRALEIAGHRKLYPRDPADAIIIFNINNGNHSVYDINIQLSDAGLELVE
ncbi:MAG: hypothetical protein J6Y67_00630 [Lachnospiraceae bacterium]|nr:hypothetical protein [Lachnospiraceae bacterium]